MHNRYYWILAKEMSLIIAAPDDEVALTEARRHASHPSIIHRTEAFPEDKPIRVVGWR